MTSSHQFVNSHAVQLILMLALAAAVLSPGILAQTTISTGSIQGTVTDPSGAVVSGAKITITNKAKGQVIELTTNSSGAYNSGALLTGSYIVRAEQKGFRTTELTIPVQVGVTSGGNIKLEVGQESQTVEVSGTAVQINTEQPAVQGVLTSQQIEKLPSWNLECRSRMVGTSIRQKMVSRQSRSVAGTDEQPEFRLTELTSATKPWEQLPKTSPPAPSMSSSSANPRWTSPPNSRLPAP